MRTATHIRIVTSDHPNPKQLVINALMQLVADLNAHKSNGAPISVYHTEGDAPSYVSELISVDRHENPRDLGTPSYDPAALHRQQMALYELARAAERTIAAGIPDTELANLLMRTLDDWRRQQSRILDAAEAATTWLLRDIAKDSQK